MVSIKNQFLLLKVILLKKQITKIGDSFSKHEIIITGVYL